MRQPIPIMTAVVLGLLAPGKEAGVRRADAAAVAGPRGRALVGNHGVCHAVALSPDGVLIAALVDSPRTGLRIFDARSGEVLRDLALGPMNWPRSLCWAPDGARIAAGGAGQAPGFGGGIGGGMVFPLDGHIRLWDVKGGRPLIDHPMPYFIQAIALGLDDRLAVVERGRYSDARKVVDDGYHLSVRRTVNDGEDDVLYGDQPPPPRDPTGRMYCTIISDADVNRIMSSVVFNRDVARVAALTGDGWKTPKLWDTEKGSTRTLPARPERLWTIAISRDGARVALGDATHTLTILDFDSGRELRRLRAEGVEGAGLLAFSPDGKYLLSGTHAGWIMLWDVEAGRMMRTYAAPAGLPRSVAFLPDHRLRGVSGGHGAEDRPGRPSYLNPVPLTVWEATLPK